LAPEEKSPLTPALLELLQACVDLDSTETKVLAENLYKAPATIRTQFEHILGILDVHNRHASVSLAVCRKWVRFHIPVAESDV